MRAGEHTGTGASLRAHQVGSEENLGAVVDEVLESRHSGTDAGVVADVLFAVHGDVEVSTDEHSLALHKSSQLLLIPAQRIPAKQHVSPRKCRVSNNSFIVSGRFLPMLRCGAPSGTSIFFPREHARGSTRVRPLPTNGAVTESICRVLALMSVLLCKIELVPRDQPWSGNQRTSSLQR
jgi:hypothetical protein